MDIIIRMFRAVLSFAFLSLLLGALSLQRTLPALTTPSVAPNLTPTVTNCSSQTDIPQAECETLVALYYSTGGLKWKDADYNNWNVTQTPCEWKGVTCIGEGTRHVFGVVRTNQNLIGTIPDLSALTGLGDLYLDENKLSGGIPDLSAFIEMRSLNLSFNQLSGGIRAILPANLIGIVLRNNQLTGTIPTALPSNLRSLLLNNNMLSGSIPTTLPDRLGTLWVSNNKLTGTIPVLPHRMTSAYLSNNQLSGSIPPTYLLGLDYLMLENNQLSGTIPGEVCLVKRVLNLAVCRREHGIDGLVVRRG